MRTSRFVILGGGMVAGYASKKLVELGVKAGDLTILSSDSALPYERPPLSKGFLAGKDSEADVIINPAAFYSDHGIDIKLNCEVQSLDPSRNQLHLRSGDDLPFDNLVIATGARVRRLSLPGAELPGVHYLRSLDNSKEISRAAAGAKQAVVIGGGFIAMEVASVLAQKGIETTMVVQEDRVWKRFFTPSMSQFFEHYYASRGVRFAKATAATEIRGDANVRSVVLKNGQTIECDIVVAGIGVTPVLDPVGNSGLTIDNGIVVNQFLETSRPGIYAAGDIANYFDTIFEKRRRVEHWDNAVSQGRHCAETLLGERAPFVHVPYFFSDVFDLSYEFWGDTSDAEEIVERGDLSSGSFSVWWLRQGRLLAAFAMNRPDSERNAAPQWIQSKQPLPIPKLKAAGDLDL